MPGPKPPDKADATPPRRGDPPAGGDQPDFTDDDIAIVDAIWDRIGRGESPAGRRAPPRKG
jgi:hypothetical protein